ncbi:Ubiquitin carboxyl-terminal hydrolase 14 [Nowakowskiella sp. JEL0078]|nr:Ubiquitin carboxyl-terminal hydrolase 14 [Nowakowskiella sp. JEL0078]
MPNPGQPSTSSNDTAMDIDIQKPKKSQIQLMEEIGVSNSLKTDVGANVSGVYELSAVLTHVGRAADSGHYIGWVRLPKREEKADNEEFTWWKFDDDTVSQISEEDIQKLEGGGDWHTAYICLYKQRPLADVPVISE